MGFCRFLQTNAWREGAGTLVATSEALALPAAATKDTDRTFVWRSLSQVGDQSLIRDLGVATAATFAGIANLKRQNGGDVELYEGGTGGSPSWNLVGAFPAQDDDTRLSTLFFDSISARHWKIQWTNGGAADYAEAGYIGLGTMFEPSRLCQVPIDWTPIDPSILRTSVDGQVSVTTRTRYAVGGLSFLSINESDLTTFRSMQRSLGRKTPFFFALDTGLSYFQWLMRFSSDPKYTRRHVPGRYNVEFDWEESR